jgi:hypothetical protein
MSGENIEDGTWLETRRGNYHRRIARRRPTRHCSFCGEANHTVNCCTSQRLIDFETLLRNKKDDLLVGSRSRSLNTVIRYFELWLYTIGPNENLFGGHALIRAFAVRKCGAYTRDRITTCYNKIVRYIWDEVWFGQTRSIGNLPHSTIGEIPDINLSSVSSNNNNEEEHQENDIQVSNQFISFINDVVQYSLMNDLIQDEMNITWRIDRNPDRNLIRKNSPLKLIMNVDNNNENNCENECSICYEQIEYSKMVKLNCSHEFCGYCVKKVVDTSNHSNLSCVCAFCRESIEIVEVRHSEIQQLFN